MLITVMNAVKWFLFSSAIPAASAFLILTAPANPLTFTLDNSQSQVTVSGNLAGFAMVPQGTGSLMTSYSGNLSADLGASSIQFTGTNSFNALVNGSWQPLSGGASGSAPADYGAQASVDFFPFGFITVDGAMRNISLELTSPLLAVSAGSFNGASLVFAFASTNAALDYHSSLLSGSLAANGYATNTVATGATVSVIGSRQTLVIPIDATFYFKLISANDTTLHLVGQLVVTNGVALPPPVIRSVAFTNHSIMLSAQNATALSQLQVSSNLTAWLPASATTTTNPSGWILYTTPLTGPRAFFRVKQ